MTDAGDGRTIIRTVQWTRLDTPGSEYFTLSQVFDGWELRGTVVTWLDEDAVLARYRVRCSSDWETREVVVTMESGGEERGLELAADNGRWSSGNRELPELEGAVDVDLGVTPSTNTFPVRRLLLEIGDAANLEVAWVRFPDLSVIRASQRYTRLAESVYRYESGSFKRDIQFDELGLVTSYPGLFVREPAISG